MANLRTADATEAAPASHKKTRLSRERIVAAGLAIAAEPGTVTISVRDLGARLGVDPTAIYRHFRNKEQLMQALLDELITRSVADVIVDRSEWQESLRQLASATLLHFVRHPAVAVEATVLTTQGTGELDAVELMLEAFSRAGLNDDEIVHHYALMASHVLSNSAGIARARGVRQDEEGTSSPWIEGPLLADPRKYPLVASLAGKLADLDDRDLFMLGVEAVIESAERRVAGS